MARRTSSRRGRGGSRRNPILDWWWRVDHVLLGQIAALMLFGAMVQSSASAGVAGTYDVGPYYFFQKQLVFLFLGALGMVGLTLMPRKILLPLGIGILGAGLVAMVLTLVAGVDVKGASRWIEIGSFRLQPSEFLKVGFIVVSGWLLARDLRRGFWQSAALLGLCAGLLLLQPDFGFTMLFCLVWAAQIFLAGVPIVVLVPMGLGGLTLLIGGYVGLAHVRSRIDRFLSPEGADTYQLDKAHEAIMSGGFTGRGPGEGIVKSTLPDAHTDFIFAVIAEEFGTIIALWLLLLFAWLCIRALRRLYDQQDRFLLIAGGGLVVLIALQVLINTSVALGLIPTTGMTLPFMSYGGTATLASSLAAGILLKMLHKPQGKVGLR